MNRTIAFIGTVGLGAVGMYLLDPTWGARRRGIVRAKLMDGMHRSSDGVAAASRELAHGMQRLLAETRARLSPEKRVDVDEGTPGVATLGAELIRVDRQPAWETNWSPAMRVACGGAGAALLGYCIARRSTSTAWLGVVGFGLLLGAGSNADWVRPVGRLARDAVSSIGEDLRAVSREPGTRPV